jgi:hypothetical protein
VRNWTELAGLQPHPLQTVGRPSALATRIGCLVKNSHQHSPTTTKVRMDCVVCHAHTKNICQIQPKCKKCNTVLCISICFQDYHTKGTVPDSKSQQWVTQGDYHKDSIKRYVIISVLRNIFLTHHVLFLKLRYDSFLHRISKG